MKKTALVLCAVVAVACESGMRSPVSPSAVAGSGSALNADGSNLKATSPLAISPLFEATNISTKPVLAARAGSGKFEPAAALGQRFQIGDSDDFANVVQSGMGSTDASGISRYTVDPALTSGKRYTWRVRAEMNDAVGPWSNMMAFTVGAAGATAPTGGGSTTTGPRPADPPPGVRLPLPDMQGVLAQFANASDSCRAA